MCRICHKRPEIPDERYGRCDACAKAGRIAYKFRVSPAAAVADTSLIVRAGELSPRALHDKLREQLQTYKGNPGSKPYLGVHEVELILAKDRLESIRLAPNLADKGDRIIAALRTASERTDGSW